MDKRLSLLKSSKIDDAGPDTRKLLEKILKHCNACQTHVQRPRHSKFTLKDEN